MQKGRDMADSDKGEEALASRRKLYMDQDFDPGHCSMPFDMRLALAAEYAAYQLGQINRKLERLIEAAEQIRGVARKVNCPHPPAARVACGWWYSANEIP